MIYSVTIAMIIREGLDVGSIQHTGSHFHRLWEAAVTQVRGTDTVQMGGI